MEYLHAFCTPDDNKAEMLRSVMKATGGFCNPNVVDKIVDKFKQKDQTMKTEPEWIKNDGNPECPVPAGHKVELLFEDGLISVEDDPEEWRWSFIGSETDIIKYRDWTAHNSMVPLAKDMTLREWYEGQALVGFIARNVFDPVAEAKRVADHMMAVRAKKEEDTNR